MQTAIDIAEETLRQLDLELHRARNAVDQLGRNVNEARVAFDCLRNLQG
jgi:hypothetical protein